MSSLPEALRLAPGLFVGRLDAHTWAVSARGFADVFANKLLVMIDGRSVYTPLFSGVFWDVQDTLLEDVERIEVIRGPGATLWGANAVNGVINVITKSARDTQGGLASLGAGTEERGFGGVRYGGRLGEETWYRAYVKYSDRDSQALANGHDGSQCGEVMCWPRVPISRFNPFLALFYNDYDSLRTVEPGTPFAENGPGPAHVVVPFAAANRMGGETYGLEFAPSLQLTEGWRMRLADTFLTEHLVLDANSRDPLFQAIGSHSPHHQISLRSSLDLPHGWELDGGLRYVDSLQAQQMASYLVMDLHLGWRATSHLEISLVGQNLFDQQHPEFNQTFLAIRPTEVEQSVYLKATYRF